MTNKFSGKTSSVISCEPPSLPPSFSATKPILQCTHPQQRYTNSLTNINNNQHQRNHQSEQFKAKHYTTLQNLYWPTSSERLVIHSI